MSGYAFALSVALCTVFNCSSVQAGASIVIEVRDDYAPFAAQTHEQDGMVSEIVTSAFAKSPDPMTFDLVWAAGSREALARVETHDVDIGYPWPRPVCEGFDGSPACSGLHFSDPVLDVVWLLFTPSDREFPFTNGEDLLDKQLCFAEQSLPSVLGVTTEDLLPNAGARVVRAADLKGCFDLLISGTVDAVAANEFQGVHALFDLDLTETVVPLPRPLKTQSLHMVVSKSHWRATALLYRFNAGLAQLRQSGEYEQIIARHLAQFWAGIKS